MLKSGRGASKWEKCEVHEGKKKKLGEVCGSHARDGREVEWGRSES